MRLYDTAQKTYLDFAPGKTVRIYTCGITPYDSAHLGHVFTFMVYDLLQRRLEEQGHVVHLVRNITDVDEPIYTKAAELGLDYRTLAKREIRSFQSTMKMLDFREPYAQPLASEYINEMSDAVEELLRKGFAYKLDGDIYFDICRLGSFGSFSGFSKRLQLAFMRSRGGDPERRGKRHPLDFLLWRGISDPDDPAAWDSPLGRGRPGWHIECSVMSDKLLSAPFDLHGGGNDLIFPHHECEIAQSRGLGQKKLAKHWVHVAPLAFDGEKMSKSLGNLVFAKDLLTRYEPAVIRLALMKYSYRVGGEWQPELLDKTAHLLGHLRIRMTTIGEAAARTTLGRVRAAIDDDLNMPEIVRALSDCILQKAGTAKKGDARPLIQQGLGLLGLK